MSLSGDDHGKNGIYVDVNGDGVIDHLAAFTGKNNDICNTISFFLLPSFNLTLSSLIVFRGRGKASKAGLCHALVVSGIPPTSQLFNGSICNNGGPVDEFFQNAAHYLEEGLAQAEETKEEIQSVDPVVIPTYVSTFSSPSKEKKNFSGCSPNYRNQRVATFQSHHRVYDSVFLVSNGKVCLSIFILRYFVFSQ